MPIQSNPLIPRSAIPGGIGQAVTEMAGQPKCNIIWVDDMKNVLDYPTSPNEQLYFGEKQDSVMWIRETDGKGQIRNPLHKINCTFEEVPFGPEANFVTKEEYQKLYDLVAGMNGRIEILCSQLS